MPDLLVGMEARLNALIDIVVADLAARQSTYKAAHGRYWQGIKTHESPPKDGGKEAPDRTRRPTDQAEDWETLGLALPSRLEMAMRVDVYESPREHGYTVSGEIEIAGKLYRKTVLGAGTDRGRAHDWTEIVEEDDEEAER